MSSTSVYPAGLPPKLRLAFDQPAQSELGQLRLLGKRLGIENADHLTKAKLVAEIVAWKLDYKEGLARAGENITVV